MALRKFLFQNQVEGFSEEQSAFDSLDLQGGRIKNLGTPINPNDAATRAYVDSVATGLDIKQSVRAKTTESLSTWLAAGSAEGKTLTSPVPGLGFSHLGGVSLAVGDRVLVTTAGGSDATPSAHNGIYVVSQLADDLALSTILTRAYDADADEEVTAGTFTFVTEGTAHDRGFVLVTDDPITLDTTALQFSQFSSTVLYTFDAGLAETAGSIKVDLDTSADAQSIGTDGGSSGLEFDQAGAAGKLRARVSPAGGVQRTADGLAAKLDPQANAAGSNASLASSSLGLKVQRAPKVEENYQAHEAIVAGEPVAWAAGQTRKLAKAMAGEDAKARIVGIARTAGQADEQVAVVTSGIATNVLWGATPGQPYYLQDAGGIGPFASIPQGARVMRLGFAVSASDLFIDIADLGKRSNDAGSAAPGGGGTPRPAVVEADGVTISGDGSAADPLAVIFAGLDEKIKVKADGVTITGDGTTAHPLVATASAPVVDQVTIKGAGTSANPFRATAPVADQLTITGAGTATDPFTIAPTSLDGQVAVITDGDTISGSGTAADPLVVTLPSASAHTDGMTLSGDGSVADPLTVQPEGLHERVRVSVLSDLLTGDGTVSSPLILDLEVDGLTIVGQGTSSSPLRAIIPEPTVASDASIDGTGAAAAPLTVNVASLHTRVRVAVDTTTITGDGTLASPLAAIIPSDYPVTTDGTLTGDGTVEAPLIVNGPALAGQVAVLTDASLTGSGVEGDPLAVVFPPLIVHTDGTSITGAGTEADPLTVAAVPASVVTDASLSGDGSVASPLAVIPTQLDEKVAVATDASISGDGTTASPLAVVSASLDERIRVASDASISGDGTTASPLVVDPSSLAERVAVATGTLISGNGTEAFPLDVDLAALAGEVEVVADGTTITGTGKDDAPLTVAFAGLAEKIAVAVLEGGGLMGDGTTASPLDVDYAVLAGNVPVVADGTTITGSGTTADPLVAVAPVDTGITQLTTDVLAGPGSGTQAATVVALQGNAVLAAAPAASDVLTWNGAAWAPAVTATTGITQLTNDVLAGPGTGTQAATVVALQGNSVAVASPVSGQVLTWNGTDWVPGSIPSGGSGGGGVLYYLNEVVAPDPPTTSLPISTDGLVTVKELGLVAEVPLTSVTSSTLSTVAYDLICGFVTDVVLPGTTEIPAGIWDFNIWAEAAAVGPQDVIIQARVYRYDGVNPPTLLATSNDTFIYDPAVVIQYPISVVLALTPMLATDRVYVELRAKAVSGLHTVTFHFGDDNPTHVHTTLPSVTGTGIVRVLNGAFVSPASPVILSSATEVTGVLLVANGGTNTATAPANGELLIGNAGAYDVASLTAGANIAITPGAGAITIASTAPVPAEITGFYGLGYSGALDFDGRAIVAGLAPVAGVYTLAADLAATTMTVRAGVRVRCNGYRIMCQGALTIEATGRIDTNATNAVATVAGAPQGTGSIGGGTNGANGGSAIVGASGIPNANGIPWVAGSASALGGPLGGLGASGGAGGAGNVPMRGGGAGGSGNVSGSGNGGNGGTIAIAPASAGGGTLTALVRMRADNSLVAIVAGTGGGGGGGGLPGGGGGGGGGGITWIAARSILGAGAIEARGGDGGNGGTPSVNTGQGGNGGTPSGNTGQGGGGAGGGGIVVLFYGTLAGTLSVSVAGGSGGAGGGGPLIFGGVGGAGAAGLYYPVNLGAT